ncbi:GyrI-like domain-containing protein [Neobacillus drentensis]|uniref:GyrI-like domain-containing protein n=1 Tax=Neobacillus drentensis TaxID=220684 RepID=UPI002FFF2831
MGIRVIEREEIKVIGISWNGTYSQMDCIPSLFRRFKGRRYEVPFQTQESILIAPFHTRETEITYYVTTPVEVIDDIPEGMVGFTIPRKNYVFSTHKGRIEEVENTYNKMFAWMKEYGYDQDHHALSMEIFKEGHKDQNTEGNLYFEIYLPIKTYQN